MKIPNFIENIDPGTLRDDGEKLEMFNSRPIFLVCLCVGIGSDRQFFAWCDLETQFCRIVNL